ncbi:hypothetical protein SVA_0843 [Sulfurifustis variabilis]|uniref:EF-hand domain-containing protein n=1 Tax=Sulfurifustis variabilis TaxID=1675686 RepID=A0A1B4V4E5_9GAMM|nr:hypothetical protein [Sulfurifustis variabilis]BAU47422.1 hypothetical protein SVA_0843 [Sulfurifustis variabilis]
MKRTMPLVFAFALSSGMAVAATEDERGSPQAGAGGGYESRVDGGGMSGSGGDVPSFSQADRDSSGSIEREEVDAIPGIDFSSSDLDSDGRLSQTEYEAARAGGGPEPSRDAPEPGPSR